MDVKFRRAIKRGIINGHQGLISSSMSQSKPSNTPGQGQPHLVAAIAAAKLFALKDKVRVSGGSIGRVTEIKAKTGTIRVQIFGGKELPYLATMLEKIE